MCTVSCNVIRDLRGKRQDARLAQARDEGHLVPQPPLGLFVPLPLHNKICFKLYRYVSNWNAPHDRWSKVLAS